MEPKPNANIEAAADEVKNFLDGKKFELVDWGYWSIECYPDPDDKAMPALQDFARQWEEFFEYAEPLTGEDGKGFPQELSEEYEHELRKIENAVNSDKEYWAKIQEEILPLYQPPIGVNLDEKPELKAVLGKWQERWKGVSLHYDAMELEVKTTQMWTNKSTGKRRRGDVLSERLMPAGFVVKVL